MRLWSLHPRTLDRQGLVACWRESLLAQVVLLGRTRGYTRHPQLERFRQHPEPAGALAAYLWGLHEESAVRGYRFDAGRIASAHPSDNPGLPPAPISVTDGQLRFEWAHLQSKLALRSPEQHSPGPAPQVPPAHPLFRVVVGDIAPWERP
ncbi:pyrimidine dimer DNA glycosylase/endonuclease V [Nesterenkonia flava]|uniref:Pyrimidine dimer DNA glycosylase/endonuclease V n=1 Tax=Nesterenkonia flava TaxID=469799 RepID=A0ABU1FUS8_9MICC|nr:pyrimidine dimer DNA glycosylase/endonuclease V [Nesterenkonia flava]MDR5711948.1 pyrimidine dimer DNA glycosylase/endonuclease V [Nesterenkonia flava]